jgi:dTDP-4-amino-4,6-dideoxygalactose transaminase
MDKIPYNKQFISSGDIDAVNLSLKNNLITTGPYVKRFENKLKKILKVKYAICCNSGTAALHLALMSINLSKNDIIIMPAINFVAVYNMARLMNAKIFLADVDPLTGQMTPATLLECIKIYKLKKIKAIVTMYLGGYPENIIDFYKIKKKLNCYLIEDACHAMGAKYFYRNKYLNVGSCYHSDISTFSLHPVKTITAGEGGIVTTNNHNIFNRIVSLRSHGIDKNKNYHWKYDINKVGFNYRLSDINCALALSQLGKIRRFVNYRKKIFNFYRKNLKKISNLVDFPNYNKNKPSYHLFLISINFAKLKLTKDRFLIFLKKNNIFCQYHYIPIYKFKLFNKKLNSRFYKGSEFYYKNTTSLPIFYNLSFALQKIIINKIKIFLAR